jgi:hypothetical protein
VLVGAADGATAFKRLDVAVKPMTGGGLHIEVEVPTALAQPIMQLIAAVKAGKRLQ